MRGKRMRYRVIDKGPLSESGHRNSYSDPPAESRLDHPSCAIYILVLAQRQVRADLIVVDRVRRKKWPQVRLTEVQHTVQALAPHGANQTLYIRILPRRSRRDRSIADAHGSLCLPKIISGRNGAAAQAASKSAMRMMRKRQSFRLAPIP